MAELLLLDPDAAGDLVNHLVWSAEALDVNRGPLAVDLADATDLLGFCPFPHDVRLKVFGDDNRADAQELGTRLRSVVFGGEGFNAGLRALAEIRPLFSTIETRAGDFDHDGALSRGDLEWAADNLEGNARHAAAWLLAHPAFLAAVVSADGDDDYLDDLYRSSFLDDDTEWWADDAPLTLGALTAFEDHLAAWSTIIFSGTEIDVAAEGGDVDGVLSKADFEAFLERRDLPPEVRMAAQQVLDDRAWHNTAGFDFLTMLEWATFVPVAGDAIDAGMMMYYLSQGDLANAFAHGLGLVPIPGLSGGAVKGAREFATHVATRYTDDGLAAVGGLVARDTAQGLVTGTVANEAEDLASDYTDNPYLLATLNVAVDARLGHAADAHRAGLADAPALTHPWTPTPTAEPDITTSLRDTDTFLAEMNAYIDETDQFIDRLDSRPAPDPSTRRADLLSDIDRLIADIDAALAE